MDIYEELVKEYDEDKEKHEKGELADKLALSFKGYALDAVDFVKNTYKIDLDFSENSIEVCEKILKSLNRGYHKDKPSDDDVFRMAKCFTGYVGQVMINRWGGKWKAENEYSIQNGPGLKTGNQELFLLSKIYRRITGNDSDNIWHFYKVIKDDIENAGSVKKIDIEDLKPKKRNWFNKIFDI